MDQQNNHAGLGDPYGPEYYASHLGPIPYERAFHWQHFFSIVAHETARSLRPRRVFDAGCAMGFLVEQFWDRGIYCEGVDISEYAISKVRSDIKPYCRVGSLTTPIDGRFDLVTCIEVLEHLPPEIVRPAVANLCAASDTILFSSSPSDFTEPTHQSVHSPIYWLELFGEFGFWPDARFDAGYVTPHAMLLRKGDPPAGDFRVLYAELIRQKIGLDEKSVESRDFEGQVKALRAQQEQIRAQQEQIVVGRQRAEQALVDSAAEMNRLRAVEAERNELRQHVQNLVNANTQTQNALQAALNSRAWRLAEKVRVMRSNWPQLFRMVGFVARKMTGRKKATPAPASEPQDLAATTPVRVLPFSADEAYERWIDENEPQADQLAAQKRAAASLDGPLISVIVPVYEPDPAMLRACVESVLAQTYPRWEMCVAITPGGDSQNKKFLRDLAKKETRVKLRELSANGGISANTNAALDLASGDFVALLDHDDTLAPFALFEAATLIKARPDADVLYSDHDYLDAASGLRRDPLFKPEWSPAIMLSANYITHLTVLRKSLVDQAGRFDSAADGAQDWDLFLRVTEKTKKVLHIPKVLYHWRMHARSTARNDSAKNYAADAQLLALRGHLQRTGIEAEPEVMPDGLLHLRFKQPPTGKVSIIIPTKDHLDLLERCVSTLLNVTDYQNFEILIVDNGSVEAETNEYFASLQRDARIQVLWHPGPFNYNTVNNRAAREASGDFLLFLNNDVEITRPDWLSEMVAWASFDDVGIVGAKLLRADGTIQHAGVVIGLSGFADHPFADQAPLTYGIAGSTGWYRDWLAVTGACLMMRHKVFDEIGRFDEAFVLCGSDVELCLRAHARGYRVVLNPFAELIHHERQTRGENIPESDFRESLKHYRSWMLAGDPYWNRNLSLASREPAFRYRSEEPSLNLAEKHVESLQVLSPAPRPSTEEEVWVDWFDCGAEQLERVRQQNSKAKGAKSVKTITWFISPFDVPFYGGIYTILHFCQSWRREYNVEISFAICGGADRLKTADRIRRVYADVRDDQVFVLENPKQAAQLPATDASICTLWTTPYFALHQTNAGRRFYLIQDFEPAFYRAGSVSALVESTYRMGLYGIANTISLKQIYETEYGGKATYFTPRINERVFYPASEMEKVNPRRPLQVFCYGRPKHPRNAFEMASKAMRTLKERMGARVRIVSAGDAWEPADYGLQGIVENLGLLSYEDTGRLYRDCQVGVAMMLTRHPSYLPLELMACGCVAVTNVNHWTSWLLKDGENCLLSAATATALADTVERALTDTALRKKIQTNALAMVRAGYLDWETEAERVFDFLCDPEGVLAAENEEAPKTAVSGI